MFHSVRTHTGVGGLGEGKEMRGAEKEALVCLPETLTWVLQCTAEPTGSSKKLFLSPKGAHKGGPHCGEVVAKEMEKGG